MYPCLACSKLDHLITFRPFLHIFPSRRHRALAWMDIGQLRALSPSVFRPTAARARPGQSTVHYIVEPPSERQREGERETLLASVTLQCAASHLLLQFELHVAAFPYVNMSVLFNLGLPSQFSALDHSGGRQNNNRVSPFKIPIGTLPPFLSLPSTMVSSSGAAAGACVVLYSWFL